MLQDLPVLLVLFFPLLFDRLLCLDSLEQIVYPFTVLSYNSLQFINSLFFLHYVNFPPFLVLDLLRNNLQQIIELLLLHFHPRLQLLHPLALLLSLAALESQLLHLLLDGWILPRFVF